MVWADLLALLHVPHAEYATMLLPEITSICFSCSELKYADVLRAMNIAEKHDSNGVAVTAHNEIKQLKYWLKVPICEFGVNKEINFLFRQNRIKLSIGHLKYKRLRKKNPSICIKKIGINVNIYPDSGIKKVSTKSPQCELQFYSLNNRNFQMKIFGHYSREDRAEKKRTQDLHTHLRGVSKKSAATKRQWKKRFGCTRSVPWGVIPVANAPEVKLS